MMERSDAFSLAAMIMNGRAGRNAWNVAFVFWDAHDDQIALRTVDAGNPRWYVL